MTYVPVTWNTNDDADPNKLNQMSANDDYLYDHSVEGHYKFGNLNRTEGLKIWSALVELPASGHWWVGKTVYFPSGHFSPGCRPIVVATMLRTYRIRGTVAVKGIGKQHPDHTGFELSFATEAAVSDAQINTIQYVNCMALGF